MSGAGRPHCPPGPPESPDPHGGRLSPLARRDFLQLAVGSLAFSGALATSMAVRASTATAQAATTPAQAAIPAAWANERSHWSDAIIVNALGGLEDPNPNPSDQRGIRDALASGLTAVNVTLGHVFGDGEPFEMTVRDIAKTDSQIRADPNNLLKVHTAADILRAKAEHKVGLIYGFQNAAMLGNDASRVEIFAGLGVKVIQLTYNGPNALGDGSMVAENRGLTPFGHEVVERLNANHVMVDLSHSGQHICLDAARASKQPISVNHTGCRALVDVPRNKTDEELRLVAAKGGFVGIYFMPFLSKSSHPTADDVVAHIEHAVNVCGEDAVGIGTDGSVTAIDDLKAYMAVIAQENADRRKAGISAPGEGPDIVPFVVNLRGVNQFYELADRLAQKGFSSGRVEKILGRNFVRYARDVWGA